MSADCDLPGCPCPHCGKGQTYLHHYGNGGRDVRCRACGWFLNADCLSGGAWTLLQRIAAVLSRPA